MEGQILGGRYEIIEKIGGGGMALVYKARCTLLNRFVAIKVLRSEFIHDEEFVKRFRIEAQSAASLSHPNIVPIYDVGNDGNIFYIVMEYIDGVTLKEYISKKRVLKWEEAVKIAIQICSAIDHAHRNNIIHRDIKPQNILMTRDGIAKVTDFGIARAISSSTITMAGSTIGSVHYFSPEQARGGFIDEKSDLYSLGIVLYEMVTGKIPFDAETPVAVALKHIQAQPVQPVEINPNIPDALNSIILKVMNKELGGRYQTAVEMMSDLYRVMEEPYGEFVNKLDENDYPTKKVETLDKKFFTGNEKNIDGKNTGRKEREKDKRTFWLALITSLIIIGIFAYIGYNIVIPSIIPPNGKFYVDNYVGKDFDTVNDELTRLKINVKENKVFNDNIQQGVIISQNILPGQELKPGGSSSIELTVSDGPELIKIPDLKMKESRLAEIDLKNLGLTLQVVEENNETVPTGLVIRTDPDVDGEVKPGSMVTIYKSLGPQVNQVTVPDLTGKTMGEAQKLLLDAKLVMGNIYPEGTSSEVAKIKGQSPLPNILVDENSAVDIFFNDYGSKARLVDENITLNNPDNYRDKIKVYVEIIPSDTEKVQVIVDIPEADKSDFPIRFSVPVPANGSTKIRILLDNKLYSEYDRQD